MTVDIATLAIRIDSLEAREATRDLDRLGGAGRRAEQQGDALTKTMQGLAAVFATMKIIEAAEALIKTQREFDKLNASLITATGSVANANQAFGALQSFAASTPYGLAEVTKAFIQLRNLGLTPSERALNSYGNTASAMSKSLDQMVEAVADAATGEFERLKEFGIKAKQSGDSVALTFQGATTNIANSAASIEKYLIELGETKFAGGMELQAKALDGAISNLGDTWDMTKLAFSQSGFGDGAMASVLALSAALTDLQAILRATGLAATEEAKAVEEASVLHKSLTTVFEALAIGGEVLAYSLRNVGKDIGALMAIGGTFFSGMGDGLNALGRAADGLFKGGFGDSKAVAKGFSDALDSVQNTFASMGNINDERRKEQEEDARATDARIARIVNAAAVEKKLREDAARQKSEEGRDDLARYAIKQQAAGQSAEAAKKEAEAYGSLLNKINGKDVGQDADFQKNIALLKKGYDEGKQSLSEYVATVEAYIKQQKSSIDIAAAQAKAVEESNRRAEAGLAQYTSMVKEHDDQVSKSIKAANDEADKNEELVTTFGMTKAAIEALELARLQDQLAQKSSLGLTLDEIETLEKLIGAKKRNVAAVTRGEDLTAAQKSAEDLAQFLDPAKAQSFGDALRDAFGGAGSALVKLTTSFQSYARSQAEFEKQRGNAANKYLNGKATEADYIKDITALNRMQTSEQLGNYGDMAGAASGFFSQQSNGYKVLQGVSQAFHLAQLAMNLASVGPAIAAGAAQMFAQSGFGGFAGVTAMLGVMAALGVATSGGGGGPSAKDRQTAAGTGSILGDSSAKSESIARAIALTAENSNIELSHTAAMAASLRSIDSSIAGLGSLLIRTTDLTSETTKGGYSSTTKTLNSDGANAAAGFAYGTLVGGPVLGVVAGLASVALNKLLGSTGEKITNAIFGGKTTAQDTGLYVSTTTLGNLVTGGANVNQYTDIKKDGGLFSSDKYNTTHTQLGAEINAQFSKVFASLYDTVVAGANLLGVGGDAFTDKLYKLVVSIPEISTKGLTGEQIQKQLETVFSKVGDDIARFGVDGLSQFQKVGEGYLETLVRVASNYANLDSILASSGTTFGQTGMASIAARERLIALTGGIDKLASQQSGFNDNFLTQAERLAPVQKYVTDQLGAMGLQSLDTRDKFKEYTLGLANSGALATEAGAKQYTALLALSEAFAKTHAATVDLTKSEQEIADERAELQKKYNELTMTSAQLREEERKAVADANKDLFDMVSALTALNDAQEAYDKAVSSAEAAMKTAAGQYQAFVDNVTSAQTKFDAAVKAIRDEYAKALEVDNKAAAAVKSERDKITDGYVAATEKVAAAQQKMVDSFLKLNTSLADFITTLDTTDLAGKSGAEQQAALESQFAILAAQARAGDVEAGGKLPEIAKNLLTIGKTNSTSALDFASLVADVRNTIGSVQAVAAGKIGDGKASDETTDLEKALAEQERWAQAVKDSGASFTKASDDLLKGYKDAVSAQQTSGVALEYWSKVAQATSISLVQTKSELATTGDGLIKGFYDAQKALAIAQIELNAANAIKGGLEFRQTSALENFVSAIKDVNTTSKAASDAAIALYEAATNKLVAGSEAALKAQEVAKDGMTYWGSIVTSSAAGIAASVQAMATAAQAIAAAQASAAAAQQAASNYASSNEKMVRSWYANNSQYQAAGGKTTAAEVEYWLKQLQTMDATSAKRLFAIAAARDSGNNTPLDISAFAAGGDHAGGMRLVGERGPEIEVTGPLRIFNANQTRDMLQGGSPELLAEMRAMREELALLRADQRVGDAANVSATKEQTRLLRDVTDGGTALLTKEATA